MSRPLTTVARIAALLFLPAFLMGATSSELEQQRAAFREAYAQAELGIWDLAPERESLLRRYILWPDLQAAFLKTRLRANDGDVIAFINNYGDLKPARELRYRYALSLARQKQWAPFLSLYDTHYRNLAIARLDCLALQAELDSLTVAEQRQRVAPLWLTAASQAEECDPVFTHLKRTGVLDDALQKERFALAIEARQFGMARYLARSLPDEYQLEARQWTRVTGEPARFLNEAKPALQSPTYRKQILSAVQRIAYDEPALAQQYWRDLRTKYAFMPDELAETDRHVALWLARNHHADAYRALLALEGAALDDEVLRWRVRTALRERRWADVLDHIAAMTAEEQQELQWQYWRAMALRQAQDPAAEAILATLADDRSYYGFLAADALDRDYAYGHEALSADEKTIESLQESPALRRALELFAVGLDGRGRSEWDAAVAKLNEYEQVQAAILAHRVGWHSRAIATAASNDRFDDLLLRFPMPYASEFENYSKAAGIRPSWALGIARSESLFMPDIRSSAGAIGVMQLMPATGRQTAKELKFPFSGRATLTDPVSNIRLGTWFLGNMQQRFADNPVLATAAYNAGPHRVDAWLPDGDSLDARIWIENIPYAETRGYVRRVLAADAIFHWRMAGKTSRLSARLEPILPKERVAALSDAQDEAISAND
ncbi:MAG: transglycosylase SLT domain-containing protein [Woeseia sp.]